MTIRVRFRQEGIHTKMRVFVGEPGQTFALAGTLAMRLHEAEAFLVALQAGPNGPIGSGLPVEIGLDSDIVPEVVAATDDSCEYSSWCVFVRGHNGPCLSAAEYAAAEKLSGLAISFACPVCESPEKWEGMPHAPWCKGKGAR